MVNLTRTMLRTYSKTFFDKLRIYVRGGTGGNGIPSLGGVGGQGGDVYLVGARNSEFTLNQLKKKYPTKRFVADPGENSKRNAVYGLKGASIFVQLPHGLTIADAESGQIIGEISGGNDKFLVARGGKGASYLNRNIPAQGQHRNLVLDLKLIADVGFVGFPNAGKSTLLRQLSRASPRIGSYPFTTINPEIGIAQYDDFRRLKLADLPGLIEGASINKGRGHSFLKHIERTNLLLFVVDVTGFQLSPQSPFRDAFFNVQLLIKELELYDPTLLKRPALLAVNKMDSLDAEACLDEFQHKLLHYKDYLTSLPHEQRPSEQMLFSDVIPISAHSGKGMEKLKLRMRAVIDQIGDHSAALDSGEKYAVPEDTRILTI